MAFDSNRTIDPENGALGETFATVERLAHGVIRDNAAYVDREWAWPEEGLRALQAAGLGGLVVPAEYDGLGHGLFALARACEILGAECGSTAICYGMHCVGASVIAARVTAAQADAYLRPIAAGQHLTTLALSEAGTGAHFYFPRARLVQEADGGLRIDGEKQFVTNGGHADSYVVSAMHDDDGTLARFSCVVLRQGLDGMNWGDAWRGFGMRGNESRTLTLDGVRTPADDLLGAEGDQMWYVFNVVAPYFLIAMSGTYLGIASAALELARQNLINREYAHDGRRLADSQVLQHRFANLWGKLDSVRRQLYSAASRFDAGDEDAVVPVLTSKAEIGEVAVNVVNEAMTLVGGMGYRDGAMMQRYLRDVRAVHVMAPTTDLLRTWAGRMLLEQPVFGE